MIHSVLTNSRFQRYTMPMEIDGAEAAGAKKRVQIYGNYKLDSASGMYVPNWEFVREGLDSANNVVSTLYLYYPMFLPSANAPQLTKYYFRADLLSSTGTGSAIDSDDVYSPGYWYDLSAGVSSLQGQVYKDSGNTNTTGTFLLSIATDNGTTIVSQVKVDVLARTA